MALSSYFTTAELAGWVRDARERTFELVADLTDEQLMGPQLPITNPLLWEMGHHAWFQSRWALRHAGGQEPVRGDEDALYDSIAVAHDTRWDLPASPPEVRLWPTCARCGTGCWNGSSRADFPKRRSIILFTRPCTRTCTPRP